MLVSQVALTECEQRVKELSGQLEMAHAANAALTSRTQLLEKFMGLQETGQDAELTGEPRRRVATEPYTLQSPHPGWPGSPTPDKVPSAATIRVSSPAVRSLRERPPGPLMGRPDPVHGAFDPLLCAALLCV